jgi:CBS domain containing-hemolysin-like protein
LTTGLFLILAGLCLLLIPVCFVQILYLESMRLRARESPALRYFKEQLEDRLRQENGALAFSLIKHFMLIGVTGILFAAFHAPGGAEWRLLVEALLASWIVMLVAAQILPQLLYRKTSGEWIAALTPLLRGLALAVRPLIGLFTFLESLASLNEGEPDRENGDAQAEELEAFIDAGAEEGLIEEDERKLIQSVVEFGDKTVREVMTPRPNIVAISQEATIEELRQLVIHEQYSRIPVYRDSIDDIVGFVHVRDLFEMDPDTSASRKVKEVMRPIPMVPETKPVDDLLRELQSSRCHMAIVVDEYGNTAGVVTMEDLVEEIVGEIRDEHEPAQDVQTDAEGAYIVSGSFDLNRLEEILDFHPEHEPESTTIGGLVSEWLGRVPRPGESVEHDGIRVEVLAGSERRVNQVRITRLASGKNGDA